MSDIILSSYSTTLTSVAPPTFSVANLIEETKRHLYTGGREPRNKLDTAVDATGTSFSFAYDLGQIKTGARLSVGLEDAYVWAVAGKTATVERGQFGSVAAAHDVGAIVVPNAKFSDAEIFRALNEEITALFAEGLYRMETTDLTYSPVIEGYDLSGVPADAEPYELRWSYVAFNEWPLVRNWSLSRDMPPASFSSGLALFIDGPIIPGRTMRLRYKTSFGRLAGIDDDVPAVTGVPTTALDILPMGAAIRLTAGREIRRNFNETQGDTRRAEEVPPGANLNAPAALRQLRQQRIAQEVALLSRQHPRRRS